jgi:SSS family solute:Na+ symporter
MGICAMVVWGLNIVDLLVVLVFLVAIVALGLFVSRSVKKESDLYLGGRGLGRFLQFFLSFGNVADSTGAVTVATAVYQQGAGGIWVGGFQTLFITPFFWFTQPWWRRARLMTMGDLFVDRYNSNALACLYAAFNIFMSIYLMGMGNFLAYTVAHAMIVKPPAAYTQQDRRRTLGYQQYQDFRARIEAGDVALAQSERFKDLDSRNKKGELESFVSYLRPLPFYIVYSSIVGLYIVLGGLRAAAVTDALQGLLILVMSLLLIPIGLRHIGGFAALHRILPAYLFRTGQSPWYEVAAITFASLVQIIGLLHNMSVGGSAKNEQTARFGMISGGFTKRLVLIAWMLCGLLALAILRGNSQLSDPGNAWGALSRELLGPGLMGLMLAGMLLGHMPSVGVSAQAVAALATRNVYEPLRKGKSERHYLRVGQLCIAAVLLAAVVFAWFSQNVISAYTMLVTFNTFFGAAIFLIIFWRRLTAASIMIGLAVWVVVMGLIPWALPEMGGFRRLQPLLLQTPTFTENVASAATADDLAAGRASRIGQEIQKPRLVLPISVYFDAVARENPTDANSPLRGLGRFNVENFILHLLGVPVGRFSGSAMTTARWAFDGVFPFVILIAASLLTKPSELARADRFFAKLRTPVAPTPESDRQEVQLSFADPHRFDDRKLLPRSQWQFAKWSRQDWLGVLGCWAIVALILCVLWAVLNVGS